MNIFRLLSILVIVMSGLLGAGPARADFCGADGERACRIDERIPSCDINLVEDGGRCRRLNCGAENQAPCGALERVTRDIVLKAPTPQPCDLNLKVDRGVCVHPPCGREGQAACDLLTRVPSCDTNLREFHGRCERPACGRIGEAPCGIAIARATFGPCDLNLIPRNGSCVRAGNPEPGGSVTPTVAATPIPAASPPPPAPAPAAAPPAVKTAGSMEANTDRPGADILGFELAQADPALCQAHCSANAQCVAWTFVRPGVAGPNARCFAKGSAAPPVANACCTSGVKAGSVAMAKPAATAPNPPPPPPPKSLLAPLR